MTDLEHPSHRDDETPDSSPSGAHGSAGDGGSAEDDWLLPESPLELPSESDADPAPGTWAPEPAVDEVHVTPEATSESAGGPTVADGEDDRPHDPQQAADDADFHIDIGTGDGDDAAADHADGHDAADVDDVVDEADAAADRSVVAMELVKADRVEIKQGGVQRVEAREVTITQGGAGRVEADQVSITMGGAGIVQTRELTLGSAASAFVVVADHAEVQEGSRVTLLIARSASGSGRPMLDWRAAAAFGAGYALVRMLIRSVRGR